MPAVEMDGLLSHVYSHFHTPFLLSSYYYHQLQVAHRRSQVSVPVA
jgi:5-hydroxyisourate hydrolase-like protein (transthyretin family)